MSTVARFLKGAAGPIVAGTLLASSAVLAMAGTSYSNFSTTVGRFNGSGYTGNQTKAGTGTAGDVTTSSVGGSYIVDGRIQHSDGTNSGSWARDFNDGSSRKVYNSINSGRSVRIQFSNDAATPVNVQVSGQWRSN